MKRVLALFIVTTLSLLVTPLFAETSSGTQHEYKIGVTVSGGIEVPLGVGIMHPSHIGFLNQRMREYDIVAVRPHYIDFLEEIETGQKTLVFGAEDFGNISFLIDEAKERGVQIIGYNLEGPYSMEEMVQQEQTVYQMVKSRNLTFMFGPTLLNLERYYADFTPYTDIIVFQSQHYQTRDNYRDLVVDLICRIKSVNPEVKVWVQVSVNPPESPEITVEEVVANIYGISDVADGVWIYYHSSRWEVTQRVLRILRPIEGDLSVDITEPSHGLYVFDKKMVPLKNTIVVGRVTVKVDVCGNTSKVKFYVDDELRFVDEDEPYSWFWDEFAVGKYEIKTMVYNDKGYSSEDKIEVFVINTQFW
ncbi:MAG TPA: hypothetical protein ENI45_04085 [Thermoplasmatales archaeon]|nr:hypothetical protein [Thermoplasmatales archaeon]